MDDRGIGAGAETPAVRCRRLACALGAAARLQKIAGHPEGAPALRAGVAVLIERSAGQGHGGVEVLRDVRRYTNASSV